MATHRASRWLVRLGIAAVALVVLVVGGTWVYINVIREDAPPELSFGDLDAATTTGATGSTTSSAATSVGAATTAGATSTPGTAAASSSAATTVGAAPDSFDGTWAVAPESIVGYRVDEVIFGQNATAVGRTSDVDGSLTLAGTTVNAATFTVDMTTVRSDESRRDNQFKGRVMDVAQFPTSTFTLTSPIDLGGALPGDKAEVTVAATGDLTLRGTTKSVTFNLAARRNGGNIEVNGQIPIVFEEWGIPNPSFGGITTEDNGLLEFLLVFRKA